MVEPAIAGRAPPAVTDLRGAYEGAAGAWASGAALLYDRLAEMIAAHVDGDPRGKTVLDAGAGTGALCRALGRRGARMVALDASPDMLSYVDGAVCGCVAGDILELPFRDAAFDAAVSGFAISHVHTPSRALSELARVVTPGGSVTVAVFGEAPPHESKHAVDDVAVEFGFQRPSWYVELKTVTEPRSNTPHLLLRCANDAGLRDAHVVDIRHVPALERAEDIVTYRSGMAHLAPFLASLTRDQRAEFTARAVEALRRNRQPVRPRLLILTSHAAA